MANLDDCGSGIFSPQIGARSTASAARLRHRGFFASLLLISGILITPVAVGGDSGLSSEFGSPQELSALTTFYYLRPQPEKIAAYLRYVDRGDLAHSSKALGNIVGFMAEIFRLNPNKQRDWLSAAQYSRDTQNALVHALWMAGAQIEAKSAAQGFGWNPQEIASLEAQMGKLPDMTRLSPGTGNELDIFWGAFFASGEAKHVQRILFAYNVRARDPQIDTKDVLLLANTIGSKSPSPSDLAEIKKFRSRYSDQTGHAVVIAATALWGLGSNANQHDRVREIVLSYLRTAYDMPATRTLTRHLCLSSQKIVGAIKERRVMLTTTRDADFVKVAVKNFIDTNKPFRVDKVFGKGEAAHVVILAFLSGRETLEYSAEIAGLKRGPTKYGSASFQGPDVTSGRASIQAALIPLKTEDVVDPGPYEVVVTFRPSQGETFIYKTMICVDHD